MESTAQQIISIIRKTMQMIDINSDLPYREREAVVKAFAALISNIEEAYGPESPTSNPDPR